MSNGNSERQRQPGPVTLVGSYVRLEPLRQSHFDGLLSVAQDERIWRWLPANLRDADALRRFIDEAEELEAQGREFPFAVIDQDNGQPVGSTRYMDVVTDAHGIEIGFTWYTPAVWGTKVNPEAKLLLMQHAFENWGAIRVCLKTDELNERSRTAILRLGARFEGILRNHRVRQDGSYRGSAFYSVLQEEWPSVRRGLLARVSSQAQPGNMICRPPSPKP